MVEGDCEVSGKRSAHGWRPLTRATETRLPLVDAQGWSLCPLRRRSAPSSGYFNACIHHPFTISIGPVRVTVRYTVTDSVARPR